VDPVDPDSEHCLQVLPERVGVASVHIDLGEHVEGHVIFPRKGLESEKEDFLNGKTLHQPPTK